VCVLCGEGWLARGGVVKLLNCKDQHHDTLAQGDCVLYCSV
jgi:hypothetical protein